MLTDLEGVFRSLKKSALGLRPIYHQKEKHVSGHIFITLMACHFDDNDAHATPPMAKKLGPDTRLKAFETRKLNYSIPANNVALIRGELYYNLLWPELVKKFTKLPKDLTAPKSIAMSEVKL